MIVQEIHNQIQTQEPPIPKPEEIEEEPSVVVPIVLQPKKVDHEMWFWPGEPIASSPQDFQKRAERINQKVEQHLSSTGKLEDVIQQLESGDPETVLDELFKDTAMHAMIEEVIRDEMLMPSLQHTLMNLEDEDIREAIEDMGSDVQ